MEAKTNAMRILDKAGIPYELQTYSPDDGIDGVSVARKLGQPVEQVYKTLVTKGRGGHFVFVIPVKDINKVTGYIRGGCSPVGMKKLFPTVLDESARALPAFYVSGGRIGVQMRVNPAALASFIGAAFAPITMP